MNRAGAELVLYYSAGDRAREHKIKAVLVRLGIRIRNISPEQIHESVGTLAGTGKTEELQEAEDKSGGISEDVLVLCKFSEMSLDRLLRELRKSHAAVDLKAVLTEENSSWSFLKLYEELLKERELLRVAK